MNNQKYLTRVCAWCKKEMGKIPSHEEGVTHGICKECSLKYFGTDYTEERKEVDVEEKNR